MVKRIWSRFLILIGLRQLEIVFPTETPDLTHVCGLFDPDPPHRYIGSSMLWPTFDESCE